MTASLVSILGLLGLVTIGIVTPGPNNMTCFIHSGLHGSRRTVPLILGMAVGFVSLNMLVVVVVLGFDSEPGLKAVIHWVGVSFIILLGLFVSRLATAYDVDAELPRLGPMAGFLMQWVNGKEWGFVILYVTQYIDPFGGDLAGGVAIVAIVTAYCLVGISAWTLFGSQLEGAFGSNRFRAMALPVAGFILVLLGILSGIRGP